MWSSLSLPPSPIRPRRIMSRRPTLLNKLVKDVDLSEVGQKLASEFHHIFGGGNTQIRDRGAEPETTGTAIVIPQVQVQTREELDLDNDDEDEDEDVVEESQELNLTSPFNDQFLLGPHNDAASATSTPRLSPTLTLSSLSANSSTDSFGQYNAAASSSSSHLPDPYHTRPYSSQTDYDELAALRAASARCAYHLPPQPRFRDLSKKRVSRSSEEMRWSGGIEGRRQAERRSGSIDAVDFAHLLAQKKWGLQERRASASTQASEKPLRSVRSFITSSSSRPATPPPPPLPTHILSQKALSSGLGLDFAEPAIVQRQPSPPPSPRHLQPRRISSSGSIVNF